MAMKLLLLLLFTLVGSSSHSEGGRWVGSEAAEWMRLGEELASAHDRGAAHAVYVRAIRKHPRLLLHVEGQDPRAQRPRCAAEEIDPKIKGNALLRCAQLAHEVDGGKAMRARAPARGGAPALFCCLYACVLTDLNESERLYLLAAKILAGSEGLQNTEGEAGETGESIQRQGGVDAVAGYARLMAEHSARRGKAEVLFRRVLKVQPSHSSSLLGLAGLLMDTGNLHELIRAEKLIHQALLLNEMDSEAVAALATLTAKTTGDYDMAEGLYRKALELDPWHLPTMCNYGLLLQGVRRDYDKARAQYQAALAISPGYPPALSFLALMHHTVYDSPQQAHALYTQALARCPTHVPTLVNLGHLTWQALGHTSEVTLRAPAMRSVRLSLALSFLGHARAGGDDMNGCDRHSSCWSAAWSCSRTMPLSSAATPSSCQHPHSLRRTSRPTWTKPWPSTVEHLNWIQPTWPSCAIMHILSLSTRAKQASTSLTSS